jgi:glycosyltransferase involved in cell wall biosynthesis
MMEKSMVSVVIPTLNSEKTIEKCLKSVKTQTYPSIEIIVVDGGSNDKTPEIANKYCDKFFDVNIKSRTYQTNFGAEKSLGKYIYRLDSDIVLSNTMVAECVFKCENENYDAVATYWGPDPSISFWSKIRKFEKDCYKYDPNRNVSRFYKKSIFDTVGGYNENLVYGEDYDIQNRIINHNYTTGFAESEGIHLGEPTTLKEIIMEQYYYGKTINEFLKQNKSQGIAQVSPLRMAFFENWKKFLKNPLMSLAFIFYEFIYYSSTLLGYLVYSIRSLNKSEISNSDVKSNLKDDKVPNIVMVISYPDVRLKKELESIKKNGYSVSLIIWERSWPLDLDGDVEIKSLMLDVPVGNVKTLFYFPLWWTFMVYWLIRMQWDAVHSVNFDTFLFSFLIAKIKRKPIVYDIFDSYGDVMHRLIRPFIVSMDNFTMKFSDAIIIADDSRINQIAKGIKNRIITINNTPDDSYFQRNSSTESNSSNEDEDEFTIFLGGKITKQRGTDAIISAVKEIDDVKLIIKGFCSEEEYKKDLRDATKNMPNIDMYLDGVSYDEIIKKTLQSDLTLALYDPEYPNNVYASPNKLFESMASGNPIIVNENTSMASIVMEENCGIVIPYNDVDAIKNAILQIKNDNELKRKLGENGRKAYISKYNWNVMEERLIDIYDSILNKPEFIKN